MAQDKQQQKRRQKALAKRKKKQATAAKKRAGLTRSDHSLQGVRGWPVTDCGINEGWRDPRELVQILVARRRPGGGRAAAIFLVDINCLGIKNANVYPHITPGELSALRRRIFAEMPFVPCDPSLAAKVIREADAYAADLGFAPHPDFRRAWPLLKGVDAAACAETIPLGGEDGKPFYVAGPHDNVEHIMATLTRRLGPRGFHFIAPLAL